MKRYFTTSELYFIYKIAMLFSYGRRRIGKTYLIKKVCENFDGVIINYQCKNISAINTINELSNLISSKLGIKYLKLSNISDIFDLLFSREERKLFVIDEYPYSLNESQGLDSIIQHYIYKYKDSSKLKLIISGSQIDIIKQMIDYQSPVFGRINLTIELKEHNYYEAAMYYPNYSNEDKMILYSVFGGEPLYCSLIDENKTAIENVINLTVKENSFAEMNILNTITPELSKINYANDVLTAIACGIKKNNDLVNKSHASSSASISNCLNKLLKLDLIEKMTPINDETNKKKTIYKIKNNSLAFYYKYI